MVYGNADCLIPSDNAGTIGGQKQRGRESISGGWMRGGTRSHGLRQCGLLDSI